MKQINRLKVVLVEQRKTGKWLADIPILRNLHLKHCPK
jgi:hypothetical protein